MIIKTMNTNSGFVALTLIIVVSSLILVFAMMQSINIAYFFDETRTKEYRTRNYYYAYDCIDRAILSISHDYFYKVDNLIQFPDMHCSIDSVLDDTDFRIIKTHSDYLGIIVSRTAKVRIHDKWLEIISID